MMKNKITPKSNWLVAIALAAQFILAVTSALAQLDETCTVTVNNQTVNVGFGGEFRIPNIPAGNNLLRVYAICTKGGKTRYGRSTFYQVRNRETFVLSELDFVWRDTPFPSTVAIIAVPDNAILNEIGLTTQIRVTATFSDSTKKDVTARGFGSTYTSSNPSVASIDLQGRVTATGIGSALITVNNEGATAVTRLIVAPPNLLTTVEGIVQLENGSPAVGATVVAPGFGETIVTDPQGKFSFSGIYAPLGSLKARAYNIVNNQLLLGITGNLRLIQGGITDAGIIVIKPVTNFVYWKDAVSGSWTDAARWNTGAVPAVNDNVFIGVPGNITVTYSSTTATTTIKSLLCDESFTLSVGSFAVSDSSEMTSIFTFSGGTLAGGGTLTLFGALTWSGGTMAAGGSTNIAASGLMDLSTATAKTSNRTINNFGTTTVSGVGTFNISNGSSFNNQVGGIFAIGSDGSILGNGSFNNMGTVRKTGATGITSFNGPRFNNNSGTVDMVTGTLNLISGGTSTGGIFTIAAGASLGFNGGTHVFSGTYSGSGAGLTQLTGGTIQISTNGATFNFTGSGFRVNGGSLTGPGILNNIGTFNWISGSISGQSIINNTGVFSISGSSLKDFFGGATINNTGTVTWTGTGQVRGGGSGPGSVFNNLAGATFNIRDNSSWIGNAFGGTPTTFINSGTVVKSDSSGTATLQLSFNNTGGVVNVQSGTLTISLTSTHPGGTFNVAAGAILNLSGTHVFSGSHSGLINGLIQIGTLQIDAAGATFNFAGKGFTWTGGNIIGPGTLTNTGLFSISGSSLKDFFGGATINNASTITWTGRGQIRGGGSGPGSVFNNLAGAIFNIRDNSSWIGNAFGGTPTTFINSGTVIKSDSSGTATLQVSFNNTGGAVNVQSGTLTISLPSNHRGGTYNVTAGAILNLSGTHVFSGSHSGLINGLIQVGTLQIDAAGATFNFTGKGFTWTGGTITGTGILTNTGLFNISGSSLKDFTSGTINNAGTVTWTGTGQIRGGGSQVAVFNNLASATFNIRDNSSWIGNAFGGTPTTFNNSGTINKSDSSGTATLQVRFNNTGGTINVQSGTLALSLGGNSTGGIFMAANGANLNFSGGTHIFSRTYSGSVAGFVQLTGGTLQIDTSRATFNFTGNGFRLNGGTITGPGALTNIGAFDLTSGSISGQAIIANTGAFNISGSSFKDFTSGATINNTGTVTWIGTGIIRGGTGSVFNNLANGTFDIQVDATFSGTAFGGIPTVFNNVGTVKKSTGTGTSTLTLPFNNTGGAIEVQSGTLAFSSGGNSTGGRITVANGTSLNLTGTHIFSGSYSGSVEGAVNLGTLQIAASGTTFNFAGGGFKWTSGAITGPGTLTNLGIFDISGSSLKDFIGGATINNSGTVTWNGIGTIRGGTGSVFNNLAGGTFDIQVDATFSGGAFGGTPTAFNNAGTVKKSAGIGTGTLALPFNNTGGAIEVQAGMLALSSGGTSTGGRSTVATGTSLNLSGTHIFSGSYSGSVDGSVSLVTLQIASSGATFNFTGGGFKWANGNIIGPGTLTNIGLFSISGSSLKDFTSGAIINNSGTVIWNGIGTIRGGTGSVFNNLANGTFDIQVDATFSGTAFGGTPTAFSNAGVFRKSAGTGTTTFSVTPFNNSGTVGIQTGILSFSNGFTQQTSSSNIGITISGINAGTGFGQHQTTSGITTLAGNLNVSLNNFTPAVGNSFQVMTFANRNNTQFANINLPALPPGRIWGPPVYTNTSLTLQVMAGGTEQ